MFRCINTALAGAWIVLSAAMVHADDYPEVGRTATPQEIQAWDIDVRPDFKGLPKGSGSVARGQDIWESRCASCHGTFGESNEVFTPLVGGTTAEDIKRGRVAALAGNKQPQKTTLMKVATLSTLWDYIHRAMPWNAPKSLSHDEVFGVLAYLLSLAEIVPDDFTLTDQNIAEVQQRMPNRNGMTRDHGLWDVRGKPDVKSVACMRNCNEQAKIRSSLPDVARNAHGNIQEQNRTFGAVRGVNTALPAGGSVQQGAAAADMPLVDTSSVASKVEMEMRDLAKRSQCLSCHGLQNAVIGPAFNAIGSRYRTDPAATARLVEKVKSGSSGAWGGNVMPAQSQVQEKEIQALVQWILSGNNE